MIKKLFGLALAAVLAPGLAAASDGPFASVSALTTYWAATSTGGALTQIYVNGANVYQRSGFGPAFVKQYFQCTATGNVQVLCNDFRDGAELLSDVLATVPASAEVWLNGALYRNGTGTGFHYVDIERCDGDTSYYGTERYFRVTGYADGWFPYSNICY